MKILIAVPCMDSVPSQFAQSLACLNKVEDCMVAFQMGSLVYDSRNYLATLAVQKECDYVFWLDSDMVFSPDCLQKIWESRDKGDIVSGLYYRRVAPYKPVIFSKLEIDQDNNCTFEGQEEIPNEIFEVAGCGFGCVLTPTNIFLDMMDKFENMFAPIRNVGEDLSFCYRARRLGYKIVVDPSVQLGHVGHYVVDKRFYETYSKAKGEEK